MVPATTRGAGLELLELDVLAAEAEDAAEVALEGLLAVDLAGALELLLGAARGRGVRPGRVGEQALLVGGRAAASLAGSGAAFSASLRFGALARAGASVAEAGAAGCGVARRELELLGVDRSCGFGDG